MIGEIKGIYYFDYERQVDRLDYTFWGQKMVEIKKYAIKKHYQIELNSQQCNVEELDQELYPNKVPPFAVYKGQKNVKGVDCQYWYVDWFGFAFLHYYVAEEKRDKPFFYLREIEIETFGFKMSTFFENVKAISIPDEVFDVSKYRCPPPPVPGTLTVEGYIKNAINNQLIKEKTTVELQVGSFKAEVSTSDGIFKFSKVPKGVGTIKAKANNFIESSKTINITGDVAKGSIADILMSPKLDENQYRVVLTWAKYPLDLDLYAIAPNGCRAYYGNKKCNTNSGNAQLDIDVRNGFGPETITLQLGQGSGDWLFFVHQYSSDGKLITSEAVLKFYGPTGLINEWTVPTTGNGRRWTVFQFDVASKTVKPINKIE
jgi:hypothetical protein